MNSVVLEVLRSLKAIASLLGVSLTAATAVAELPVWVTIAAAVATAVATWSVPNLELGEVD